MYEIIYGGFLNYLSAFGVGLCALGLIISIIALIKSDLSILAYSGSVILLCGAVSVVIAINISDVEVENWVLKHSKQALEKVVPLRADILNLDKYEVVTSMGTITVIKPEKVAYDLKQNEKPYITYKELHISSKILPFDGVRKEVKYLDTTIHLVE